jgi:uncharacterized membrane protein YeiH
MGFSQSTVLDVLDLCGVAVFAASGAVLAIRRKFDIVGLLTLAFVASLGGGVLRDLLLSRGVPVAFDDPNYAIVAFITGLVILPSRNLIERVWRPVLVLDAAGLGLFCVTGASIAAERGLAAIPAVMVGVVAATGGGVIRDVLAGEAPQVFQQDSVLYVIPAAMGASVVVIAHGLETLNLAVSIFAALSVTLLRVAALHFGWHAPLPHPHRQRPQQDR